MQLPNNVIKPLARAGYSARGLIYLIVGAYAVGAAVWASQKKDSQEAVRTLMELPFGTALVWLLVAGLFGYAVWRVIQSLFDTDKHGLGFKGIVVRTALLVSAATYFTLMVYALSLSGVLSSSGGDSGSGNVAQTLASFIGMSWTALVLALVFAGVAIAHWWKAARRKYADHFKADGSVMSAIHVVSITGLVARGVVFAVIAVLMFYRFRTAADAEGEPGLKAVMDFVHGLPYGQILLGLLGAGLIAFAAYSFAEAIWRRINVEDA